LEEPITRKEKLVEEYNHKSYLANLARRKERVKDRQEADTPLKDLRVYFTYKVPNTLFYLLGFANSILRALQQKGFRCPGYSHIYISIGETKEEAIARAHELEDWYRFGIAVLPEAWMKSKDEEKEKLVLKAIVSGLKDIAALDGLDTVAIDEAVALAKQWGAVHETIFREKENKKYKFRVSHVPVKNEADSDIYFALIDRDGAQEYKWKFGRLHAMEAAMWFFKITVTNKLIRTKPAARTDMILKGKKKELELSIENIINGSDRIVLEDTAVPVEKWIIDLEKQMANAPTISGRIQNGKVQR
jgi:hypothetical protein